MKRMKDRIFIDSNIFLYAFSEKYNFSYYDSIIVSTALENECNIVYSEDMQHSQIIENKLTIINPFKKQLQ